MARNYRGGMHILAATYTKLSSDNSESRSLTVRNDSGNGTVYFSPDGLVDSGYIKNSEGREFKNVTPDSVYVKGTAGENLYWDAT